MTPREEAQLAALKEIRCSNVKERMLGVWNLADEVIERCKEIKDGSEVDMSEVNTDLKKREIRGIKISLPINSDGKKRKYGDWKCDTVEIRVRNGEIIFYQGEDMIVIEDRIWNAIVKDFGNTGIE